MASLSDISLNHPAWTPEMQDASREVWRHSSGDALGVFFYNLAPDLGAGLNDIEGLRSYYRNAVAAGGGALVETDVVHIGGAAAARTIVKLPQTPSGMTYVGSLTVAFESFSFVVKAQCEEHGMTGMRDAAIFAELNLPIDEKTGQAKGWMQDPYDASFAAPLLRNLADDKQWDERFPDHPLSRCRRTLDELSETISLSDEVKNLPPFSGPVAKKPAQRWWWPFGRR